jgi:hypothetical protein
MDTADLHNTDVPLPAEEMLLHRIRAFRFDEGAPALPFAARLARENGWTLCYAERVIEEYRRFMFLAVAAGHPVTPSDQVDQAWHLHLLYTRSYWNRFCKDVLQQRIDHDPTEGGRDESRKFLRWYEETLASYRRYFGEPPADIWPRSAIRFGDDLRYVRINVKRTLVIPKARLGRLVELGTAAILIVMLVISI